MVRSLNVIGLVASLLVSVGSGLSLLSNTKINSKGWNNVGNISTFNTKTSMSKMALVEKSPAQFAGLSVLERPLKESIKSKEPTKDKKSTRDCNWEVRIYNDGTNTREHVARCLVQLTGLSEMAAYQTMMQAHQNGIAVVRRWVFERAEMYRDALVKNGIHCDMVPVEEDKI